MPLLSWQKSGGCAARPPSAPLRRPASAQRRSISAAGGSLVSGVSLPRPGSAASSSTPALQRPRSAAREKQTLSRWAPLHAASPAEPPLASQLRSAAEALRRSAGRDDDLETLEGVRAAISRRQSLAWALPHADACRKLLQQRPGSAGAKLDLMDRVCGKDRFPPMGGGGVSYAAASVAAATPALSWQVPAKVAGLEAEVCQPLASRLRRLMSEKPEVLVWLVVETCRDCAAHATSFRHDEIAYISRYQQLKETFEQSFPRGTVAVDLLVPRCTPPRGPDARQGVRIGAFEVFLCCAQPLKPFGSVALSSAGMPDECMECRDAAADEEVMFSVVCLASKLQTLAWPDLDEVLARFSAVMPRIPLTVSVKTAMGLPVPGVRCQAEWKAISAPPPHGAEAWLATPPRVAAASRSMESDVGVKGVTDEHGSCTLEVPICITVRIGAWHQMLMKLQKHEVTSTSMNPAVKFVAETVVQLWQREHGKQLLVYCASPRALQALRLRSAKEQVDSMTELQLLVGCEPFRGELVYKSGLRVTADAEGCLRGNSDLLAGLKALCTVGYCVGGVSECVHSWSAACEGVLEVACLNQPQIGIAVVSGCCDRRLPKAEVRVDDKEVGSTGPDGEPVRCQLKYGDHILKVKQCLAPSGMCNSLKVTTATSDVRLRLAAERLSFVCAGYKEGPVDLWLVAGDPAEFQRRSQGALAIAMPGAEPVSYLWSGELRGLDPECDSPSSDGGFAFQVSAGKLLAGPRTSRRGARASLCKLALALSSLQSQPSEQLQVQFQAWPDSERCSMELLSQVVLRGKAQGMWLARMMDASSAPSASASGLRLRSCCCGSGFAGAQVTVHGEEAHEVGDTGCVPLDSSADEVRVCIAGVPPVLLPGNVCSYVAHRDSFGRVSLDLEVACLVWIYWIPACEDEDGEEDEPGEEENAENIQEPEDMVWIAVDDRHVPESARAVKGTLCFRTGGACGSGGEQKLLLDGSSVGPFRLRTASDLSSETGQPAAESCPLSTVSLSLKARQGYEYRPRDPSPLATRCDELGGCELQRLVQCPAVLGVFRKLPPPPPHCLRLHKVCCGMDRLPARVYIGGKVAPALEEEPDCFFIPRSQRTKQQGALEAKVEGIPPVALRIGKAETRFRYGPGQPEAHALQVLCALWIYWVPPEGFDDDDEEEEDPDMPPQGMLWLAADPEQIPAEAEPVKGVLTCDVSAEQQVILAGRSIGPFILRRAADCEGSAARCLMSHVKVDAIAPKGFEYIGKEVSPMEERWHEIGGCEYVRTLQCPVVMGHFRCLPVPPMWLSLRTSCCGGSCLGAKVSINRKEPVALADDGTLELRRKRKGGDLHLQFEGVPPSLLPGGAAGGYEATYGPAGPASFDFEAVCRLWVYWVPPEDEEEEEDALEEDDSEPLLRMGMIFIAVDKEHVPEDARPVVGRLECPLASTSKIVLDGRSMGPYELRLADDESSSSTCSASDSEALAGCRRKESDAGCLLANVEFRMLAPEGYKFEAKQPSPLAERCLELGGCELQRLAQCPVVVGKFMELPPSPPNVIQLRTECCGCGFERARVMLGDRQAPPVGDEPGCFRLRRRKEEAALASMPLEIQGVPPCLLPGLRDRHSLHFEADQPDTVEMMVACRLWVYWVPPAEDETGSAADEEPRPVWVTADAAQIPPEARPVSGVLECAGAEEVELDGGSFGPFKIMRKDDDGAAMCGSPGRASACCLLSGLALRRLLKVPPLYEYQPMAERCGKLGVCELQALASRPLALGLLRPLPAPPLKLSLRTTCCRRGFLGAKVALKGQEPEELDEAGCIDLLRPRRGGTLELHFDGLPAACLPGESKECKVRCGPLEPACLEMEALCKFWIYWTPPEEDEEAADEEMPAEGLIWIAADKEHVDDLAAPLVGQLVCPEAAGDKVKLDGSSMGPFELRCGWISQGAVDPCILSTLSLENVQPPAGYEFRAKRPSPLAERCIELGGCELQRLANCPMVIGFLPKLTA
eukprot:TRINITY_DN60317_c0_g1_i1.p1 TRINITY_DN60317_c0_g1~~TRINITY_DN60317_c0_g1_i1.p1  ORF type:complete len:1988 (+),score=456.49 TRINITY_DN60317_c0_g1_i1:105-6068(+)